MRGPGWSHFWGRDLWALDKPRPRLHPQALRAAAVPAGQGHGALVSPGLGDLDAFQGAALPDADWGPTDQQGGPGPGRAGPAHATSAPPAGQLRGGLAISPGH